MDADKERFETLYNARDIEEVLAHHTSFLDECHIFFQDDDAFDYAGDSSPLHDYFHDLQLYVK